MSNSTLQLALEIALQTKNLNELDQLSEELRAAGVDVSKLTDESAKLAKQFGEIEQKQALINQFRELKTATNEANTAWKQAQTATADYAKQMDDARERADALKVSLKSSGDMSKDEAKATRDEYKATLQELKNLDKAYQDSVTRSSQLKTRYEDLNTSLSGTRTAMHDLGLATTNLNNQQKALEVESQNAKKSLAELTSEAKRLDDIAKAKIKLGIDTDDNARKQIQEVTTAYETLRKSGTLSSQELARANQLHTQKVAELEAQLGKTKPTLEDITAEFGKVTAAAGGIAYVTKQAMDFETAMSGVKKVVEGTPEQYQALSAQLQQMSIDMGMTTTAIAEIAAQGGQLGVPIEKLGEFTKMAGQMSVAFGMSAESAGDAAAKMANVFGIPIEKVGELGDAINVLGNTSAAKESEIVDVMQRIGGQAKQFGLATEQAAALSAAFISLGKTPEVAGTAINALLTKLQTANVQSDDFKNALAGIGINANQLADDINANPQQALSNFLNTLAQMDSKQRSVATFKLFGQEYVDDVNALVGGLDTYNKALDSVSDRTKIAGAMQKEFEEKNKTSAVAIEQAKQSISVLAQTVGKELLPVVAMGAKAVAGLAQGITDFAKAHPVLTDIAVLIASAQVALVTFNGVIKLAGATGLTSFAQIATGAVEATTAINATTASATRLETVMGGVGKIAGNVANVATSLNQITIGADLASGSFAKLATQAMAVTMAFDAGQGVGDWLYKNSELARGFGDHLASIPAAIHSIVTTGSLDQFVQNFEMSSDAAKRLANEAKTTTEYTKNLASEQYKAAQSAKEQASANLQLANDIKLTQAIIDGMKNKLAEMETGGQKNTQAYKDLSAELQNSQKKLADLQAEAEKQGIGESLKTDLDKASAAFEALGLDAEEFANGIDSKTNAALKAFVDVAHLAEGDTRKLALAYNAAKDAAGDNKQAQDELVKKLFQVTEGNGALSRAVLATAEAQRNAKNATDEQAAALDKLGISMSAANQGMSKGGAEMVQTLKAGITAIKEQATSADALRTSLQQAFAVSISSAQTKADFVALQKTIIDTGTASQLTAEQSKILQAGITGGAEAAKKAKEEIDKQTKALTDNAQASDKSAVSNQKVAQSHQEIGESAKQAADKAKQATEQETQARNQQVGSILAWMQAMQSAVKKPIADLQDLGVTADQVNDAFARLQTNMMLDNKTYGDFGQWLADMKRMEEVTQQQAQGFRQVHDTAVRYTQALSGANVGVNELADAQGALRIAQDANVAGIIKMDNATLDNLKRQIDSTRQKLDDLADSAKATADNLEADLARMKGDDAMAQKLEQTRKLTDLQAKLNEAQKRGNSEEIAQYQRAIELQKQYNAEQTRQAEIKKQQEQQAQAQRQQEQQVQRQRAQQEQAQNNSMSGNSSSQNIKSPSAQEVAAAWDERIKQAEARAAEKARTDLLNELHAAAKAQAR